MTVTLYLLENSRADRILWLLEEIGQPFKLKVVKKGTDDFTHMKSLHPLAKSPMIEDNGKVVVESARIVDYLVAKYGKPAKLQAKDNAEAETIQDLALHCEASLSPLALMLYVSSAAKSRSPFYIRPVVGMVVDQMDAAYASPQIKQHLNYMNDVLKTNGAGFFVGDHLSAADILYSFPVNCCVHLKLADMTDYPELKKWHDAITSRPAYKKAHEHIEQCKVAPEHLLVCE